MVFVRVTTLLLVLLFLMQTLSGFSTVLAHREKEETLKMVLGGRKMRADEKVMKQTMKKEKAPMISGARAILGFEGKSGFNRKNKNLGGKSISSANNGDGGAHFVAFGTDYHGPKRHPPKHN